MHTDDLLIICVDNTLQNDNSITTNVLEGLNVVDIIERIYAVRDGVWSKNV